MDAILSFLAEHYPVIIVIVITAFITWWAANFYRTIKDTKKTVDNLPCNEHGKQIGFIDELKKQTSSIDEKVIAISSWVCKLDADMITALMQRNSPYTITPVGEILLEKCFGKQIIDEHIELFTALIHSKLPKTKFDIETFALAVLIENLDNEIFNDLKNFVYEQSEIMQIKDPDNDSMVDIRISMPTLLQLISIYLRDKYIEKQEREATINEVAKEVEKRAKMQEHLNKRLKII